MKSTESVKAYDAPERVASYDADMELMHPNRSKMVAIALEVLPFCVDVPLNALDLGIGTSFYIGDFRELDGLIPAEQRFDVIYSSCALHHVSRRDKVSVIRQAMKRLKPGGWFLNADLIVAEDPAVEKRIQEIRVAGIVRRASGQHDRFLDVASTRRTLDDLEAKEADQPLTLLDDLSVLREAGLRKPAVFWVEYRETVRGGMREA